MAKRFLRAWQDTWVCLAHFAWGIEGYMPWELHVLSEVFPSEPNSYPFGNSSLLELCLAPFLKGHI